MYIPFNFVDIAPLTMPLCPVIILSLFAITSEEIYVESDVSVSYQIS